MRQLSSSKCLASSLHLYDASHAKVHVQMIRELPMDRETHALARQSSTVPIWLQENKPLTHNPSSSPKKQSRAVRNRSPGTPGSPRRALHTPKHNPKTQQQQNSSMNKPRLNRKYMGFIRHTTSLALAATMISAGAHNILMLLSCMLQLPCCQFGQCCWLHTTMIL